MTRTNVPSAATINYLELIGNGKSYCARPYQSGYAWREEEWEDLWNDVLDLQRQPDDRHYMGALVVQGRSDREFTITDGQQRLATISILSLAVIAKLHRMADEGIDPERNVERANGLRNRFRWRKGPCVPHRKQPSESEQDRRRLLPELSGPAQSPLAIHAACHGQTPFFGGVSSTS